MALAKFINKRDDPSGAKSNDRIVFFSKTPNHSTESEIHKISDIPPNNEFNKLTGNKTSSDSKSKSKNDDRYTMITDIIDDEKRELHKIQNMIRKRSVALDVAKKRLRESQDILETHLDRRSNSLAMVGEMSAKVIHDIKNPVTVIKAQVDLLKLRYSKEEDVILLKSLERMERAVYGITNNINDILNFVRDAPTTFDSCSLLQIINESMSYVDKPDDVAIELPNNDLIVACDATKLQRVFTNMIANSIQALQKGGNIWITLSEQNEFAVIQITDSGPGIPTEVLPNIFDHFFTTKKGGTGLGLSICKKIVEDHGGSITVQNNPTTFVIRMPKTQPS